MPYLILIVLFAVSFPIQALDEAADNDARAEYAISILVNPLFEPAQLAVETVAINNWLIANYGKLTQEEIRGPREHLYYLIDSRVKQVLSESGSAALPDDDLILRTLFFWAENLGVYGGALVYNALKRPEASAQPQLMVPPETVALGFDGSMFQIRSHRDGWSVAFPYYFMINLISEFQAVNGMQTQFVSVATGAARHTSTPGHSQATLMLISSPKADYAGFREFWMRNVGIAEDDELVDLGLRGLASRRTFDDEAKMHKELVFIEGEASVMAVAYLGIDGTYQWNRPHFIDFLRHIEVSPSEVIPSGVELQSRPSIHQPAN
jgi:hypothetical protein